MSSRGNEKEKGAAMELFCVICRGGGVMELGSAVSCLSKKNRFLVNSFGPFNFINRFSNIFQVVRGTEKVEAIMPLKFCLEAAEKNGCPLGSSCLKLHLCPYFIRGKCTYKAKCRCSHDIKDQHTLSMLYALNLQDIDNDLWLQLLKKVLADTEMERGASTHEIPEICKFYNNQGGCRMGDKCAFLHICQHFVDGTCKFGDGCKRDHDLLKHQHNVNVFQKFNLLSASPIQLLYILRGRERKRTTSTGSDCSDNALSQKGKTALGNIPPVLPQSPSAICSVSAVTLPAQTGSSPVKQSTSICGFYLRGQCNYGQKCINLHKELPYQWQLQDVLNLADSGWKDLLEDWNIMLEREYCDPSTNVTIFYHQGQSYKTDFDKMTAVAEKGQAGPPLKLRRLSTESSAEAPPGHIFSTRWKWYWQDEKNQWQCYDSPDDGYEPNTTCSKSLEKEFLQGKESHPFSAGHHSYTLYYKKMFQKNNTYQTERAVRRRPEFVAKDEMKEIEQRRKEAMKASKVSTSSVSETTLPPHWVQMPENKDYVAIPLLSTSQEYIDVKQKFRDTSASKKKIIKIERIQNPDLWTAYIQKKGRMMKKANDAPPKEMPQLFHGTSNAIADAICQQGFDWRMCGKHGTAYGQGSYFASTATYSHRYTDRTNECKMFIARVLVGSYDVGKNSMTRPPPKDPTKPHGDLHDSCVNDVNNPSLFVVFDNSQSYPEYLITYKNEQKTAAVEKGWLGGYSPFLQKFSPF